ncbi:PDZ domain-containing protein [Aurantibacter sp.]|uniref:aspartyl protease family protein n=1 Tax=Aurantibacter sp. TaxID=2807103 RepID=UPI003266B963
MKHLTKYILIFVLCVPLLSIAQTFTLPHGQKYQKIKFQLINNLIVLPIEVNGAQLSFILDTGVRKPILFNLDDHDPVHLNNVSEITIRGLGEGEPIKALSSKGNTFKLNTIENNEQQLFIILDSDLNFSPNLGIPVHGIIGYDLFRDFIVDINYFSKTIKFHSPELYSYKKRRKTEVLPLLIRNSKAYVEGQISLNDESDLPVRLLIDTGSSDAVWLFEDDEIGIPEKHYDDFLGEGLNGSIFGKRTKLNRINLGSYVLNDAKTAFPDKQSYNAISNLGNRNGSLGGEMLKRFNIIFDFPNQKISLKKNKFFKMPFHYNLSGITLQHNGLRYVAESIADSKGVVKIDEREFGNVEIVLENRTKVSLVPEIVVSGIRAGSPAHDAGLREGDVVLAVDGKKIHHYKLQDVMYMLDKQEGKKVRIMIQRSNNDLQFSFTLKKLFQPMP